MSSKSFKQLGYFDELRKDVLEGWMKSEQGLKLEQQITTIISSQAEHFTAAQYSTAVDVEEEKARLTSTIRDKISESGVLKSLSHKLSDFVNSAEWKERINKDLESMKYTLENTRMDLNTASEDIDH